jgi:hypothetical protein
LECDRGKVQSDTLGNVGEISECGAVGGSDASDLIDNKLGIATADEVGGCGDGHNRRSGEK